MQPMRTPPRRRNAQVRTYWRLLQHALKQRTTTNEPAARTVYKQLQHANTRLARNSRDTLEGIDVADIVAQARELLGLTDSSLPTPGGGGNE